jgi:AraC-like DNA-binding protein
MKLFVKYMVSIRCKLFVQSELEKLGFYVSSIDLGQIELPEDISEEQKKTLDVALRKAGLELIDDKKSILIEKIKNVVIEVVHYREEPLKMNFSDFLSKQLNHEYNYLSNLFSEVKGTTIEHFLIMHKIERVKELLLYDELTLTEIAYQLNYSSVSHLSNQFKKITGLTPSFFRLMKNKKRTSLEDI